MSGEQSIGGTRRAWANAIYEAAMPFYKDHVYPHLVSVLGNPKPIEEIRRRIIPLSQGNVLEVGVGPGVNFTHYDPARVSKLYALEPNPGMLLSSLIRRGPL